MKDKQIAYAEHNENRIRSIKNLLLIAVLAAAGVAVFLGFYDRYNDGILYAERLNQMKEVTAQLFYGLEDVTKFRWSGAEMQCSFLMEKSPQSIDELLNYMESQSTLSDMKKEQIDLIAVDTGGKYYTQDGEMGILGEQRYLLSNPERISFVTNSLFGDKTQMVFLKRLSTPVILNDRKITYYGIAQNMTEWQPYFDCEAYDGNNGVYVLDEQGLKIFSDDPQNWIKGYNVYSALSKMEYLHDSTFEQAKAHLDAAGLAYSNAVLNGEEYYYAMYKMKNAAWTLLFLVPSDYVATNTVELVNASTRIILIFALSMAIFCAALIFVQLSRQQKAALEIERRNGEKLEGVNRELSEAVDMAERAEQAAKDASRAKSDFLSNMSHDIRTPMNAIVGITKLMAHEKGNSEKMRTFIDKVQISSQYLLGLINDILDMSKIESNKVTLNRGPISLSDQVEQMESIVRPQAAEKNQKFEIHAHEIKHEFLIGDSVRLRQIMLNLLANAVKYTQEGGSISFEISELECADKDCAKFGFVVTDNGCGMPKEYLQHIFEPFTRAENSTERQGTGLGMAITKNIVDLMGGEIAIESELDKGSRFEVTITFPIDHDAECIIDAKRILLLTDDDDLVQNVRAPFYGDDISVFTAATEKEAAEILDREDVDIILLSGVLYKENFSEIVRTLRQIKKDSAPILGIDYVQPEQVKDILDSTDIDNVIARPFFKSRLVQAISRTYNADVAALEEASALQGMRFICAEDNELNAEILKALLDMKGAECDIYRNGEEIVRAFADVQPGDYDAVLMDIQMPVMNGLEAAKAIRNGENKLGKTIPIIAMTANAFSEDVQSCIDAGMDAHVPKPLDIERLERTILACIKANMRGGGGQLSTKERHK